MPTLRNRYFALRHGESTANTAGVIISDPIIGISNYGLSDIGIKQVENVIKLADLLSAPIAIYSSDFLRTRETAQIIHSGLNIQKPIVFTPLLRERFFGSLNGSKDKHYQNVWDLDASNPNHTEFDVESVNDVLARTLNLIRSTEKHYNATSIVLVAHGDILQILQTWFEGVNPAQHRQLSHLQTPELRRYKQSLKKDD